MEDNVFFQKIIDTFPEVLAQTTQEGKDLWSALIESHPADIAQLLANLKDDQAFDLFSSFDQDLKVSIFKYCTESVQADFIVQLDELNKQYILSNSHVDDVSDMFAYLSDEDLKGCLRFLHTQDRQRVLDIAKLPAESAGGIMNLDIFTLLKDLTVGKSIEVLQRLKPNQEIHPIIYVTDAAHVLQGYIRLQDLVLQSPLTRLESILHEPEYVAHVLDDQEIVAQKMMHYQLSIIPVVDEQNHFLGIIPSETLLDVVQEEAREDVQKMMAVPIDDESYFDISFWKLFMHRGGILAVLMMAESVTSMIVHSYQHVLSPFLVAFFAMLVSTGGNTSSQTSAIVIQGMSSGIINDSTVRRFLKRELLMGLVLGLFLGLVTSVRAYYFEQNIAGTIIVSLSVMLIVLLSVLLGAGVPVLFKRIGVDPAFSAGPFLATLMDILGIFIYCYIAWLVLA